MRVMLLVVSLAMIGCPRPLPPKRAPTDLVVTKPVQGIRVRVDPYGYTAWRIAVRNNRADAVRILWDESTFIGQDSIGYGRLLRGRTPVIDRGRAQLASVVAPGSSVFEFVMPEDLRGYKPRETAGEPSAVPSPPSSATCNAQRRACKDSPAECAREHVECRERERGGQSITVEPAGDAHPAVSVGVGRMVLTFDGAGGREVWEAAISLDGSPLPEAEAAPPERAPAQPEPSSATATEDGPPE